MKKYLLLLVVLGFFCPLIHAQISIPGYKYSYTVTVHWQVAHFSSSFIGYLKQSYNGSWMGTVSNGDLTKLYSTYQYGEGIGIAPGGKTELFAPGDYAFSGGGDWDIYIKVDPLVITSPKVVNINYTGVAIAQSYSCSATGGVLPYTWDLVSVDTSGFSVTQPVAGVGDIHHTVSSPGTFKFTIKVTDSNGDSATQQVSLVVTGSDSGTAPQITSATSITVVPGKSNSYQIEASGSPVITFGAADLPSWATYSNGIITFTVDESMIGATDEILLSANNSYGHDNKTLTVTVAASGTGEGEGEGEGDTDDDVPAINELKDKMVEKFDQLKPVLDAMSTTLDESLGVQKDILTSLNQIRDKLLEPPAADPSLPTAPTVNSNAPTAPEVTLPELEDQEIKTMDANSFMTHFKSIWNRKGNQVSDLKIPLHYEMLNDSMETKYIDFCAEPLRDYVGMFRNVVKWALFFIAGWWFIRIIKTFEF